MPSSTWQGSVATEQVGALVLKSLTQPVVAYNMPLSKGETIERAKAAMSVIGPELTFPCIGETPALGRRADIGCSIHDVWK